MIAAMCEVRDASQLGDEIGVHRKEYDVVSVALERVQVSLVELVAGHDII